MGSLSFLFLANFDGNANISVAIKSGSTVMLIKQLASQLVDCLCKILYMYVCKITLHVRM